MRTKNTIQHLTAYELAAKDYYKRRQNGNLTKKEMLTEIIGSVGVAAMFIGFYFIITL